MTFISSLSVLSDIPHRLHWSLWHAWNVICLRRWLIIAVALGCVLVTVLGCLALLPTYSATCIISLRPNLPNDY